MRPSQKEASSPDPIDQRGDVALALAAKHTDGCGFPVGKGALRIVTRGAREAAVAGKQHFGKQPLAQRHFFRGDGIVLEDGPVEVEAEGNRTAAGVSRTQRRRHQQC